MFQRSDPAYTAAMPSSSPLGDAAQPSSESGRSADLLAIPRVSYSNEERHKMTERLAYFRAEQRGFEAGDEMEDWLWAEEQIARSLEPG